MTVDDQDMDQPAYRVAADVPLDEEETVVTSSLAAIETMAVWSPWVPFAEALGTAPPSPGVYMARERATSSVIYVGMAGPRRGKGLRGRLGVYASGKALTSGLGEAVADRAFADPAWVRDRLVELERGQPLRARGWGVLAFERADLEIRWTTTADGPTALRLEGRCGRLFDALWNRAGFPDR